MKYSLDELTAAEAEVDRAFAAYRERETPQRELLRALQNARGFAARVRWSLLWSGQINPTKDDLVQTVLDDMFPDSRPGAVVTFDERTFVLYAFPASRPGEPPEIARVWCERLRRRTAG